MKSMRAPFTMPDTAAAAPVASDSEKSDSDDDTEEVAAGEPVASDSKGSDAGSDWVHFSPQELPKSLTESSSKCLEPHLRVTREISWTCNQEATRQHGPLVESPFCTRVWWQVKHMPL